MFREVEVSATVSLLALVFQECLASMELAVLLVPGPSPNLEKKICWVRWVLPFLPFEINFLSLVSEPPASAVSFADPLPPPG